MTLYSTAPRHPTKTRTDQGGDARNCCWHVPRRGEQELVRLAPACDNADRARGRPWANAQLNCHLSRLTIERGSDPES